MKLKYLNSDYTPKGEIEDFPLEIIDKMIERQVEQGRDADVKIFEENIRVIDKGFDWGETIEGYDFWIEVIDYKNFDVFFEKYPKEKPLEFPRVIEVRYSDSDYWIKRVCIKIVGGEAVCWGNAETLEETENERYTIVWRRWREVGGKEEYKPFDFSDGVGEYEYLLGKKLISKDNKALLIINSLCYEGSSNQSYINNITTSYLFENFTFSDGSPLEEKFN